MSNFFSRLSRIRLLGLVVVCSCMAAQSGPVRGEFLPPDGLTRPFRDWTRGDANSTYAEWDVFTFTPGVVEYAPDAGTFPTSGTPNGADSLLVVNTDQAEWFTTSGANIYSPTVAMSFTATAPSYGLGAGWNTRAVLHIQTLGTEVDPSTLVMRYNNGSSDVAAASIFHAVLDEIQLGGFGGTLIDQFFVFDVVGFNPSEFAFDFGATGPHMSLGGVAIDAFTTQSPLSAAPEPAGWTLAALAAVGLVFLSRRRKARVA
jgi:hypothetical protein